LKKPPVLVGHSWQKWLGYVLWQSRSAGIAEVMTASRPMPDIVAEHGIKQEFERGKKEINSINAIKCSAL
jgi:hypothetical protein